jgi:hypothetical protein
MTQDVGLGQPHHGNVCDRVEPAGDLGEPGEPVKEIALIGVVGDHLSTLAIQLGSARRSPSAVRRALPISIPDPVLLLIGFRDGFATVYRRYEITGAPAVALRRQFGQRRVKLGGFKVPTQKVSGVLGSARNDVTTVWAHGD